MANYIFKTTTTMKEYNNKKWWIDPDSIREMRIQAKNIEDAVLKYKYMVFFDARIDISDNALKTKEPMYVDTQDGVKQVGYVITGRASFFENIDNYKLSKQYIDLWVTILTVVDTDFD